MNKEWIHWPRGEKPYQDAAQYFVDMVWEKLGKPAAFGCPCVDCKNLALPISPKKVYLHLLRRGMDPTYTEWFMHGEPLSNPHQGSTHPTFVDARVEAPVEVEAPVDQGYEGLANLVEDADSPLYPGCKTHTKLSITIELYRHKTVNGISRNAFDDLLQTTGSILPPGHCLPKTTYEVKKLLRAFQLTYEKIHACVNDCCLFRKENKDLDRCPICKYSRWKEDKWNMDDDADKIDVPKKKIPVKVLRYFPIVPRLKRLYNSAELAEQLIWHATHRSKDGKIRHPSDSLAWKHIDNKWPEFASDSRNLRFGLSTDGFNPFGDLSPRHSCWPVMLVIYNLPPTMCMQAENIILSLLIPGKKQPGKDIDVYLQPLIDDLIELWGNGVEVYDAFSKTMFNLKALLMWTINDFPAYGNLSGCTYKGKAACPLCGDYNLSNWLPYSRKTVYLNHRRFLPAGHVLRKNTDNGEVEMRGRPPVMSGADSFERQSKIVNDFGKASQNEEEKRKEKEEKKKKKQQKKNTNMWGQSSANDKNNSLKRKREVHTGAGQGGGATTSGAASSGTGENDPLFNKRSIFFDLPYWKVNSNCKQPILVSSFEFCNLKFPFVQSRMILT